jgi:predicted RNase H-like nuclease (RuvC/YqgF family)
MSNTEEVTTVQQTDAIEIESGETIQATTADGQTIQLKSSAVTQAILTAGININGNNMVLPHQPIDMTAQEEEKLDRKRQRNRVAATKCRKRKIERITQLEQEVRELNDALQKRLKQKRELEIEVDEIRNRLKIHIKQGCSGLEEYLQD